MIWLLSWRFNDFDDDLIVCENNYETIIRIFFCNVDNQNQFNDFFEINCEFREEIQINLLTIDCDENLFRYKRENNDCCCFYFVFDVVVIDVNH